MVSPQVITVFHCLPRCSSRPLPPFLFFFLVSPPLPCVRGCFCLLSGLWSQLVPSLLLLSILPRASNCSCAHRLLRCVLVWFCFLSLFSCVVRVYTRSEQSGRNVKRNIMNVDLSVSLLFVDTLNALLQPAVPEWPSLYDAAAHIKVEKHQCRFACSEYDCPCHVACIRVAGGMRKRRAGGDHFYFWFPLAVRFFLVFFFLVACFLPSPFVVWNSALWRQPFSVALLPHLFGCSFACFSSVMSSFSFFFGFLLSCSLSFLIVDRHGNIVRHERGRREEEEEGGGGGGGGSCVVVSPTRSVNRRFLYVSEDVPLISLDFCFFSCFCFFHSCFCFGKQRNSLRITCSTSVFPLSLPPCLL